MRALLLWLLPSPGHPPLWHNCGAGSLGGASLLRGAAAVVVHPRGCPEHYEPFELTDVAGALAHARWQGGEWGFWAAGISRFLTCRRLFFLRSRLACCGGGWAPLYLMRPPDRALLDTWSTALLVVVRMCACTVVWDVWVCGMRSTSRSVDLCVLCLYVLLVCSTVRYAAREAVGCTASPWPHGGRPLSVVALV